MLPPLPRGGPGLLPAGAPLKLLDPGIGPRAGGLAAPPGAGDAPPRPPTPAPPRGAPPPPLLAPGELGPGYPPFG